MHDPSTVAFEIKRPWPARCADRSRARGYIWASPESHQNRRCYKCAHAFNALMRKVEKQKPVAA